MKKKKKKKGDAKNWTESWMQNLNLSRGSEIPWGISFFQFSIEMSKDQTDLQKAAQIDKSWQQSS